MFINFKIVTPSGVAYQDDIKQVSLPTADGEITVLANHVPLVTLLRPGEMTVVKEEPHDGTTTDREHRLHFAVAHGVAQVQEGSKVVILSDTADRAEEIDVAAADEARARAQKALQEKEKLSDVEFSRVSAALERELAKIKVGRKYQ